MRRRRLLLTCLALGLALFPALPAAAADDPNVGTLEYTGERTYSGGSGPEQLTVDLDCDAGVCVVDDFSTVVTFVDGVFVANYAGSVGTCDFVDPGYTGQLDLTPETITGVVTYSDYSYDCDGFGTSPGFTSTWNLAYVSGETCLIDGSCEEAAAVVDPASSDADEVRYAPGGSRPFATPTEVSSVATLAEAITPANILWAAAGTVVLAILVVIPTQFANSAADTLVGRAVTRWRRWRKKPEDVDAEAGIAFRGWPWAAAGVLAAAVIASLADPNFGFDAASLRLFLSILATFAIEVVLGWLAVVLLVRRTNPTVSASFQFAPLSLVIVIGAVLLSRLSGFEPPIIFGLVAGVAFAGLTTAAQKARVALISLGWAFGIGLVAWVAYSLLPVDLVALRELLSTAAIAGISALPIALLPLRGFIGRTVWEWRLRAWIIAYAVGLFAFMLVLLPLPGSWSEVDMGLATWVAMFIAYFVGAFAIWLVVTRPWAKDRTP